MQHGEKGPYATCKHQKSRSGCASVQSGYFLFFDIYYSIHWFRKWQKRAQIRLIRFCIGCKLHKGPNCALHIIWWSGGAKVLCILHHRGVQLILAYNWARPAILVVGKGRGGMFLFLLFLHFLSCSSFFPVPLFHLLYSLFYLFSLFLWETTQNDPQGLTCR